MINSFCCAFRGSKTKWDKHQNNDIPKTTPSPKLNKAAVCWYLACSLSDARILLLITNFSTCKLIIEWKFYKKQYNSFGIWKTAPLVRVRVLVKVRVSLALGCNQTIALEENCPWLGLGFGIGLVLGLGGSFSWWQLH